MGTEYKVKFDWWNIELVSKSEKKQTVSLLLYWPRKLQISIAYTKFIMFALILVFFYF